MTTQPLDPVKQLEMMREGIDYSFTIKCRKFEFKARPLSISEQNNAFAEAQEMIEKIPESARTTFAEAAIIAQKFLVPASKINPDDKDGIITEYLLNRATAEELQYMYKQYCAIVDKCNPQLEELPIDQIKGFVEALKKKKPGLEMDSAITERSFLELVNITRLLLTDSEMLHTDS